MRLLWAGCTVLGSQRLVPKVLTGVHRQVTGGRYRGRSVSYQPEGQPCRHLVKSAFWRATRRKLELARLVGRLDSLLERLETAESAWAEWLAAVAAGYRASARNIVHYWAIRQTDLRELQHRLAGFGLSSLGRSEPHVEATLRLVRSAVLAMLEGGWRPPVASAVGADEGGELLRSRTVDLLGPTPADRETRIMVTLPSEAATDPQLVRRLGRARHGRGPDQLCA